MTASIEKLLNVDYPLLLAPMGNVSGGRLATAVSRAGGFGIVGGGYGDKTWLQQELRLCRAENFGVGFITWALARDPSLLDVALDHGASAIFLSFGECAPYLRALQRRNVKSICQVQSVRGAREAADLGADVIVAQGDEAGGHGGGRGTFTLVPSVIDAVSPLPVIAAGGIVDGRGIAAAFKLGAAGVLVGTRFYASEEALAPTSAKRSLIAATGDDTIRTRIFDIVRGYEWPDSYTGRALVNDFVQEWHGREEALREVRYEQRELYTRAVARGDTSQMAVFAGSGVDAIQFIEPAERIMKRLIQESRAALGKEWGAFRRRAS